MINVNELTVTFNEKLMRTGSFDEAFVKAVWVAYNKGLTDGGEPNPVGLNYAIMDADDLVRWAKPRTELEGILLAALRQSLNDLQKTVLDLQRTNDLLNPKARK